MPKSKIRANMKEKEKANLKLRLPKVTSNNEQDVLDACWTESTIGGKLRNKIRKRIERVKELNKSQYSFTSRGGKPAPTPSIKGMGKRNMSSLVLLVQETNRCGSRNSGRVNTTLKCNTPRINPINCSFAGRVSAMDNYITNSKASRDLSGYGALSSAREARCDGTDKKEHTSFCRDNSAYETLRDQLYKITLKLDMEGNNVNISEHKQRRTREQRCGRNLNNTSIYVQSQRTMTYTSQNSRLEVYNSNNNDSHNGCIPLKKETTKRPLTRNESNLESFKIGRASCRERVSSPV